MEERKNLPLKEVEAQKGGKQARVMKTRSSNEGAIIDRRGDQKTEVLAWAPALVLDKVPLPSDASIRAYTTLLPSVHQALPTPRPTLPPRWQRLARTAPLRPLSLLTALPRRPSRHNQGNGP